MNEAIAFDHAGSAGSLPSTVLHSPHGAIRRRKRLFDIVPGVIGGDEYPATAGHERAFLGP